MLAFTVNNPQKSNKENKKEIRRYNEDDGASSNATQENMKKMRENLLGKLNEDKKNSMVNYNKMLTQIRAMMRQDKTMQLKKEVDDYLPMFNKFLEEREAIMNMLDRDLDRAEEQFRTAAQQHQSNLQLLQAEQKLRIQTLDDEFNTTVKELMQEYIVEMQELEHWNNSEQAELDEIFKLLKEYRSDRDKENKEAHDNETEAIKNKYNEQYQEMKNTLDNKVDKMNDTFKRDYEKFREDTKKKQIDFETKIETDNKASRTIKKNNRHIDKLKRDLESLTNKRAQNEHEWKAKNEALEQQKSKLLTQYNDLKKRMASFRNEEARRLKELSKNSKGCVDRLRGYLSQLERILRTAEMCRKMETEREKVLPFYDHDEEVLRQFQEVNPRDEIDDDEMNYQELAKLENFFKRYNKVLLDKLAIDKQKKTLEKENAFFKSLLKEYLDGCSVNDDVIRNPNPLLVINERIRLNRPVDREEHEKAIVEGNAHINNITRPYKM